MLIENAFHIGSMLKLRQVLQLNLIKLHYQLVLTVKPCGFVVDFVICKVIRQGSASDFCIIIYF